jgi:GNAT superfamily N-acetyltransferase
MVTVDFLKNHPNHIEPLSQIWYDVLGKIWIPGSSVNQIAEKLNQHLNENVLPITLVAIDNDKPLGMCSLRENSEIRPALSPWLGLVVVDAAYQRRGVGRMLINATKKKAQALGFKNLYLFTFDPILPEYYAQLGWNFIGQDEFKEQPVTIMEIDLCPLY